MLLAETVIQLCAMAEHRKEPKKGAAESGLTRIARKVLAERDIPGTVTVTAPRQGTGGAGPRRERLKELCAHDAVIYF